MVGADDEGLRQTIRLVLDPVGDVDAEIGSVALPQSGRISPLIKPPAGAYIAAIPK